jgi:hypothetical protein
MAEYVLLEVDKESLDKLEAHSFTVVEQKYYPRTFGNSYATLSNQRFSIMLIRDTRGEFEISLRVAPRPIYVKDGWWELEHVLEMLQSPDRELLLTKPTATQVVECFLRHYPTISSLFARANRRRTSARLKAVRAQRSANMIAQSKEKAVVGEDTKDAWMEQSLLAEIYKEDWDELVSLGFTVIEDIYINQPFGNAYATLVNQSLRIMLVRDRSQIMMQVAPLSEIEEWITVDAILDLLGSSDTELLDLSKSNPNPAQVMKCFLKNYPEISIALAPENLGSTNARLDASRAKRVANMMAQYKRPEG